MFGNKGLSIYYVSSYKKAGSFRMLTNAYLREQGFIQKLMEEINLTLTLSNFKSVKYP